MLKEHSAFSCPPLNSTNVNHYLGSYIRFLRKSHRMTQKDIADMLDITYQQVQKYENGTCNITLKRLCQICESLKMPVTDALKTIFQLENLNQTQDMPPESHFIDFFESFRGIHSPEFKKLIFHLCKEINEVESQHEEAKAPAQTAA